MRHPAAVVLGMALVACAGNDLPPTTERVATPAPAPQLAQDLAAAERHYANGIECGTQFLSQMHPLAVRAEAHPDEFVAAIEANVAPTQTANLIRVMGERSVALVPALVAKAMQSGPRTPTQAAESLVLVVDTIEQARRQCLECRCAPQNNRLQLTGREGGPASRAIVGVAPRS